MYYLVDPVCICHQILIYLLVFHDFILPECLSPETCYVLVLMSYVPFPHFKIDFTL